VPEISGEMGALRQVGPWYGVDRPWPDNARDLVEHVLASQDAGADVRAAAMEIAEQMVANAYRHALAADLEEISSDFELPPGVRMECGIVLRGGRWLVRIAVCDPLAQAPGWLDPTGVNGRGAALVAKHAAFRGFDATAGGKQLWVEIDLDL
jgi:hypothetical protein